jgi:hypothetical protein
MKTKVEWKGEMLDEFSSRHAVIGGWIVTQAATSGQLGMGVSLTSVFVADKDHEWTIYKPEEQNNPSVIMEEFGSPTL